MTSSGPFHSHKGRTVDKQRVSLTKKNLETASGKELLKLIKSIKSDGRLSKDEVVNLVNWLNANKAWEFVCLSWHSKRARVTKTQTDHASQASLFFNCAMSR